MDINSGLHKGRLIKAEPQLPSSAGKRMKGNILA